MKRLGGSSKSSKAKGGAAKGSSAMTATRPSASGSTSSSGGAGKPSAEAKAYFDSLDDPTAVEMVRTSIKNAHVFKLPPRAGAGGYRGADWKESDKIWVGTVRVVDRGNVTAIVLLTDNKNSSSGGGGNTNGTNDAPASNSNVFAVCPYRDGAVDRCIDSSRYFVLRVENKNGQHMFLGLAFNERNSAFDFNTALQDSVKDRQAERHPSKSSSLSTGPTKDYSLKEGQKIHVNISKLKINDNGEDGEEELHQGTDAKMKSVNKLNSTSSKSGGLKKLMGKPSDTSKGASKIVRSSRKSNKNSPVGAISPPSMDSTKPSHRNTVTEAIDMFGSEDEENVDFGGFTADFAAFPANAL